MKELLFNFLGIFPALVIILCQFSCGKFLDQRFGSGCLGFSSRWVLGVSFLALLNALWLSFGLGSLIHLNIIFIIFYLKSNIGLLKFKHAGTLTIGFVGLFFLIPNVLTPIIDWGNSSNYLLTAQQWLTEGSLNSENLRSDAKLPQLSSVIWTWGLLWGNETTCQFIDLFFFLALIMWVIKKFELTTLQTITMILICLAATFRLNHENHLVLEPSWLSSIIGTCGNSFYISLLLVSLFDCTKSFQKSPITWGILATALINTHWHGIIYFFLSSFIILWIYRKKCRPLLTILLPLLIASPWYLWNWVVHHNPVYPHFPEIFGGSPYNNYLLEKYNQPIGINNFKEFTNYLHVTGLASLIYILSVLIFSKKNQTLFAISWFILILTLYLNPYPQAQLFPLLVLSGIVVSHSSRFQSLNTVKGMTVGLLIATSFLSLKNRFLTTWEFSKNAAHGQEFMKKEMISLYSACHWLNQQENTKEIVLWPMKPHYYCSLPVMRYDEATYQLPNHLLSDSQKISEYFKNLGVRWLILTPRVDSLNYEPAVQAMEQQLKWMTKNDPDWEFVKLIPQDMISPEATIWRLKDSFKANKKNNT